MVRACLLACCLLLPPSGFMGWWPMTAGWFPPEGTVTPIRKTNVSGNTGCVVRDLLAERGGTNKTTCFASLRFASPAPHASCACTCVCACFSSILLAWCCSYCAPADVFVCVFAGLWRLCACLRSCPCLCASFASLAHLWLERS